MARAESKAKPKRRVGRFVVLLVLLAVAGIAGVTVLFSSDRFSYGNVTGGSVPVGEVMVIGMGSPSGSTVVRHADAVIAPGSPAAATTVLVCRNDTHRNQIGPLQGWSTIAQYCAHVMPAAGAHLRSSDYLLLTVVPLAAGRIEIDGVRVTHSSVIRDRSERTGSKVVVTAN
ncbi:MAG TPA: hypothetical protein VFR41_14725 [Acidimicrobiia bacterium]|nr:hypothetical protein [Acidimicrobiia bacterium]